MDTDRRDSYIEKELSMNLNSDNIGLARSIHHSQNYGCSVLAKTCLKLRNWYLRTPAPDIRTKRKKHRRPTRIYTFFLSQHPTFHVIIRPNAHNWAATSDLGNSLPT